MSRKPRYPHAVVDAAKLKANAFAILAAGRRSLEKAGATEAEQKLYLSESMSGDYDHLLKTLVIWVTVVGTPRGNEHF